MIKFSAFYADTPLMKSSYFILTLMISFLIAQDSLAREKTFLKRKYEGSPEQLIFYDLEKMSVSKKCVQSGKKCLMLLDDRFQNKKDIKESGYAGNPASLLCRSMSGNSLVLEDKKMNQYDFCEITEGIIVDSWDLVKRYKK